MCVGHGWAPLIPPRFSGLSSLRQTPAHRRSCACFTAQTVAFGASSGCAFLAGSWPLLGQILASPWPARLVLRERIRLISRTNRRGRAWTRGTIFGGTEPCHSSWIAEGSFAHPLALPPRGSRQGLSRRRR